MYLHARKHIHQVDFAKTQGGEIEINPEFTELMKLAQLDEVKNTDYYGASVEVVCAYWRKANAIHGWFVKNVQDNRDDCRSYYVDSSQLKSLKSVCENSLLLKNPHLLMPVEGFFFGHNDIDGYYWAIIKNTIEQLDRVFALPEVDDLSFYYQSSW